MAGTDKNMRMLDLHYKLLTKQSVNKESFCTEHNINSRAFDRDIEDIRAYLSEVQPYCELKYDRTENKYFLTHSASKPLDAEIALFISNIIMSVKGLSTSEMNDILNGLFNSTEIQRNSVIRKCIEDKNKYLSEKSGVPILKMHWDLERAIQNQYIIELKYETHENCFDNKVIKPMQQVFANDAVYLMAYIITKKHSDPAFFRLDRIKSFKVLPNSFSEKVQIDYKERLKEHDIYNMIAGEEITVLLEIEKDFKRILCDVFRNCKVKEEKDGKYICEIKTYKQGFMQWLLGQERYIKVIAPVGIQKEIKDRALKQLSIYE